MTTPTRYLVELQCQPSPVGHEERIARELGAGFDVRDCRCTGDGVSIELAANHPVAYGAFKDLADQVIATVSGLDARLLTGVIHHVDHGPLAEAADTLGRNLLGRRGGSWALKLGRLFRMAASRITGGVRLRPVMYFYQGLMLDLHLTAKANQLRG